MAELATALGEALGDDGPFVLVTGRSTAGLQPLSDAAGIHLVAPGPSTRLTVGQGAMRAGRPAVVALDRPERPPPGDVPLAVTTEPACAAAALQCGWTVIQPYAPSDMGRLLEVGAGPQCVLLHDRDAAAELDPPRTASRRQWVRGDLATIAASGAAVGAAVELVQRLRTRGVGVSLVEIAVLDDIRQELLVGGTTLVVCGPEAADPLRRGQWPLITMEAVSVQGVDAADLVGAVLARVPTAP